MKCFYRILWCILLFIATANAQTIINQPKTKSTDAYDIIKTRSHIPGLEIALLHKAPAIRSNDYAILFLHGSSFPSALSFGFRMNGYSWMDHLAEKGYDTYALDFLGYGQSSRYPEMDTNASEGSPVGRAVDVYTDVDKAVNLITNITGKSKVYLVGHSWGGSVAALYASRFPDNVQKLVLFAAITPRQDSSATQKIRRVFDVMTPDERVEGMKNLTPAKENCQLEHEVSETWGNAWLLSDPLTAKFKSNHIRFPAGPSQDVEDMLHNRPYYDAAAIRVPVLIIRGEWDEYPDDTDAGNLFKALTNAPYKKYIVLKKGTHVMHLEKSRNQLYDEILRFLKIN